MKYRILLPGETLRFGDEIDWHNDGRDWRPVRYTIGEVIIDNDAGQFRRPVGGRVHRDVESAFARIASVVRRIFLR